MVEDEGLVNFSYEQFKNVIVNLIG